MLLLVLLLTVAVEASALSNVWGWWFNNGKELDLERKVNIVAQMMTTGGDIMATAAYVKVCRNTVTKYWNLYLQNGTFTKEKQKPGPKPALGAGALFYLFYLVQLHNAYTCAQYADRLFQDLGISVTDWVIMRALQRLGLHRKTPTVKKVEGLAPHSQLLRQRYFDVVFALRLRLGPSSIHRYVFIDET